MSILSLEILDIKVGFMARKKRIERREREVKFSAQDSAVLNQAYRSYMMIRKNYKNPDETWKEGAPGDILLQYSKVESVVGSLNPNLLENVKSRLRFSDFLK